MKEIQLTRGKVALVDDEDFEYLNQFKWMAHLGTGANTYYAITTTGGSHKTRKILRMHRVIMNPSSETKIDHKDRNGLNNQKSNLREANNSQNSSNRTPHGKTSRFIGVHLNKVKSNNKVYCYWKSCITPNGKFILLGYFKDEISAAKAYNKAAIKYFGEFATLNDLSLHYL